MLFGKGRNMITVGRLEGYQRVGGTAPTSAPRQVSGRYEMIVLPGVQPAEVDLEEMKDGQTRATG